MKINEFLYANRLKQKDLAEYLGISEPSISKMVKGLSNPSKANLYKMINNDKGWDTSMLIDMGVSQYVGNNSNNNTQVAGGEVDALLEKISMLERLLEEKERTINILLGNR